MLNAVTQMWRAQYGLQPSAGYSSPCSLALMCLSPISLHPHPPPSRFSTSPPPQELLGDLFIHPNMLAQEEMLGEGAYATVHKARCGKTRT